MTGEFATRRERVLARQLRQGGEVREPGATVRLRQDQIARLEPGGYFEPLKARGKAPEGGKK